MGKVKILAVGIGGFAVTYLNELLRQENPNFEIVGMVSRSKRSPLYPVLAEMGVPYYKTMEVFYEEHSADLAIITTPIHLHTQQILCALRNGSHVMCEKPLSGDSGDEAVLEQAIASSGRFVMIGYQWSYAKSILELKQDIMDGLYGAPVFMKTMVCWPRTKEYFTRGSGWGGKIRTADGEIINDSVLNNATAHYLHNMLYVTGGAVGKSNEVASVTCNLLRVNEIENFDTVAMRVRLADGTPGLYLASHAVRESAGPIFEYRFEKGIIKCEGKDQKITGYFPDGTTKEYGSPSGNINEKIYTAIENAGKDGYIPPCGVAAAAPQVRCVEMVQKNPIYDVQEKHIRQIVNDSGHLLYVEGLDELMMKCYQEEKILSDYPEFEGLVEKL